MTPPLHPRSRLTTSLFGTTLLVSFLVVAMPHILPCPVPRVRFADADIEILEDGQARRRRQTLPNTNGRMSEKSEAVGSEHHVSSKQKVHECPMPRPNGKFGEILGFKPAMDKQKNALIREIQIEPRKAESAQAPDDTDD